MHGGHSRAAIRRHGSRYQPANDNFFIFDSLSATNRHQAAARHVRQSKNSLVECPFRRGIRRDILSERAGGDRAPMIILISSSS